MSSWMTITMRGKEATNYEHAEYDDADPWDATGDICATADADDRIVKWTAYSGHVYMLLDCDGHSWEFVETIMDEYGVMMRDAVVLSANDTSDLGEARYYPEPTCLPYYYKETEKHDGHHTGELALAVMHKKYGIDARDPFHNKAGTIDFDYVRAGNNQLERDR